MRSAAAERVRRWPHRRRGCVDPRGQGAEATIVRFGFEEASLDAAATRRLDQAVDWARCATAGRIVLAGAADQHGTPQAQQELIAGRVGAIRQYLVKAGVADERISTVASIKDLPTGDSAPLTLQGLGRGW